MQENNVLEMRGITKIYPGVVALDHVDFFVERGSVHALMGENGAGKSTLIKVLTGVIKKDKGSMILDGNEVQIHSVHEANKYGISAVYQELDLIPELSISENIFMGREILKKGFIDWKQTNKKANEILHSMGIELDVSKKLLEVSTAMQQMVSIARAISIQSKLVVLDEPTSSLDTSEVEVLFRVIKNLKDKGIAVIFITHRLDEIFTVCDTVTILKDGKLAHRCKINEITKLEMVSKMIGRDATNIMGDKKIYLQDKQKETIMLQAEKLKKPPKVYKQNIVIHKGEVLGLAGLLGAGRTELARLLFGADSCREGNIKVKGKDVKIKNPRQAIKNKIGFCSEDRKVEGIIPNMSIRDNMTFACLNRISHYGFISKKKQQKIVDKYVEALRIKISDIDQPISSLSGGNQQKVLLARWLCANPEILILDEPTRGIDVGAKKEILDMVCELAEQGIGILMISSILEELVQTCDRIQVIRDGQTIGQLTGNNISEAATMRMIANEEDMTPDYKENGGKK